MAKFDIEVNDPLSKRKTYRLKGTAAVVQVDRQENYDDIYSWDSTICRSVNDSFTTNITLEDVRLGSDEDFYNDYVIIWRDDSANTEITAKTIEFKTFGDREIIKFSSDDEPVAWFYTEDIRGIRVV